MQSLWSGQTLWRRANTPRHPLQPQKYKASLKDLADDEFLPVATINEKLPKIISAEYDFGTLLHRLGQSFIIYLQEGNGCTIN